jgi:hypothetical protein
VPYLEKPELDALLNAPDQRTPQGRSCAGSRVWRWGSASFSVTNSTVTANTATIGGGGLYEKLAIVTLAHTIVSGNAAPSRPEVFLDETSVQRYNHDTSQYDTVPGEVVANDFNLIGHGGDAGAAGLPLILGGTDIVPSQPLDEILGPLANNGGPTMTHALVAGSPALDVVPVSDCGATDQRGVTRPQGPRATSAPSNASRRPSRPASPSTAFSPRWRTTR